MEHISGVGEEWKKKKPDTRWKPLGSYPHPFIEIYYAVGFSATILTNTAGEQWPLRTNFDKSPSDVSAYSSDSWTFTRIYPPFKHWFYSYMGVFPLSPLKCEPSVTHTLDQHASKCFPGGKELSRKTNIRFGFKSASCPDSWKSENYIIYEWWQIPVLECFQETLEIKLLARCHKH